MAGHSLAEIQDKPVKMITETTNEHLLCTFVDIVHLNVFSVVTRTHLVSALKEFIVL